MIARIGGPFLRAMKITRLLALSVCLAALPSLPAQDDYNTFVTKLSKALEYKDEKGIDKAIKEAAHHALLHYEMLVRDAEYGSGGDSVRETMRLMQESWKRLWNTETLERVQRFIGLNGGSTLQQVDKAVENLNKLYTMRDQATANKDRAGLATLKGNAFDLANQIERLGHAYRAAETWALAADILYRMTEPSIDERRDGVFALERFMEQRKEWDWTKDTAYLQNQNLLKYRKDELERDLADQKKREEAGYKPDAKGADALVMPNAVEEIQPLEFKPLKEPQQDLFWRGGPTPALWIGFVVRDHGPEQLAWFRGANLFLMWEGGNKYGITTNGTEADPAKADLTPVQAAGKLRQPSTFFLDPDHKRQYAMWFYLPGESEPMMGLNHNLAPREKTDTDARSATIYYLSAASWTAKIGGETVTFYDDNSNGKLFEEDPMEYGLKDRALGNPEGDGIPVPAFDSMRIGKGPLQPLSRFVQIGAKWYHMRPHEEGAKVGIRELNPEFFKTGTVAFKWSGPPAAKPESVLLRGRGEYATACYNIVSSKPIAVPAGEYDLAFGRIQSGKGAQVMSATIAQGEFPRQTVEPGGTLAVEFGAPFRLEFVRGGSGDQIEIDSLRFRVLGKSGELYARLNNAPLNLEVLCNKTPSAKGAKTIAEFIAMPNTEILNELAKANSGLGIEVGFFPVVKGAEKEHTRLLMDLPIKGGVVGLQDRKHKLFGKIEPVWK